MKAEEVIELLREKYPKEAEPFIRLYKEGDVKADMLMSIIRANDLQRIGKVVPPPEKVKPVRVREEEPEPEPEPEPEVVEPEPEPEPQTGRAKRGTAGKKKEDDAFVYQEVKKKTRK